MTATQPDPSNTLRRLLAARKRMNLAALRYEYSRAMTAHPSPPDLDQLLALLLSDNQVVTEGGMYWLPPQPSE